MAQTPLPARVLPVAPLVPDDVEIWFADLARGLDYLVSAVNEALDTGTPLAGFELLTSEEAFGRIVLHLEEAESATVFQLLACAEAQLHQCEQAGGPFRRLARQKAAAAADGLVGCISRIQALAAPSQDTSALKAIVEWSEWRNWYAHGRRFEVPAPQVGVNVTRVAQTVRDAITCAQEVIAAKLSPSKATG